MFFYACENFVFKIAWLCCYFSIQLIEEGGGLFACLDLATEDLSCHFYLFVTLTYFLLVCTGGCGEWIGSSLLHTEDLSSIL